MKIRLIVPNVGNRRVGDPLDHTSPITRYGPDIAKIAGGFTAWQGIGSWIDGKGKLVVESITVFDVYDYTNASEPLFQALAKRIAKELHQDCVYLEIDGEVNYVTQ